MVIAAARSVIAPYRWGEWSVRDNQKLFLRVLLVVSKGHIAKGSGVGS